jgi:hypothetical protein
VGVECGSLLITGSLANNFTNEGGVGGTFRLLKNVQGCGCSRSAAAWAAEAGPLHDELVDGRGGAPFTASSTR